MGGGGGTAYWAGYYWCGWWCGDLSEWGKSKDVEHYDIL